MKDRDRWTRDGNFPSEWEGKLIYEGDIGSDREYIGVVRNDGSYYNAEIGIVELPPGFEVIGNIHDNQELLADK